MAVNLNVMQGDNVARLNEIARFAIGSNESIAGGKGTVTGGAGRMGIIDGHVIKFNTHSSERLFGPSATDEMRASCNQLRSCLYQLASDMGVSQKTLAAIRSKLGVDEAGHPPADAKLLDRKVVASVINLVGGDKNLNVWSNLKQSEINAVKSKDTWWHNIDTRFNTVRAKADWTNWGKLIDQNGMLSAKQAEEIEKYLIQTAEEHLRIDTKDELFDLTGRDLHRGTVVKLGDVTLDSNSISPNDNPSAEDMKKLKNEFKNFFGDEEFADFAGILANQHAHIPLKNAFINSLSGVKPFGQGGLPSEQTISFTRLENGSFLMKADYLCHYDKYMDDLDANGFG